MSTNVQSPRPTRARSVAIDERIEAQRRRLVNVCGVLQCASQVAGNIVYPAGSGEHADLAAALDAAGELVLDVCSELERVTSRAA